MLETRDHIELTPAAVVRGYKSCRIAVKDYFKHQHWMAANLPTERRRALDALLTHAIHSYDLLDLESPNQLPLDVWTEARDDVGDAFNGKCTSVELAALADGCIKFSVPKQYLFDMLDGADWWIRTKRVETYENLKVMAYRLGGSLIAAAVPILGFLRSDYEVPAIRCGQAVLLTHVIANCVHNLKVNRNLIPLQDFEQCEVDLPRLRLRKFHKNINYLVRLYCSRLEELFYEAGKLIHYLDFDGVRTVKSLLAYHWNMMIKMKIAPECILDPGGVFNPRERFNAKARHILGLDIKLPIFPETPHHH